MVLFGYTERDEIMKNKAKKGGGNHSKSALSNAFSAAGTALAGCLERISQLIKKMKNKPKKTLSARQKLTLYICAAAVFLCAAGGVSALIINSHIKNSTEAFIISADSAAGMQADCILVLGCGLNDDGTPGWILSRRLETGLELYRRGAGKKLIMSGDHGRTRYDEVNAMKAWAMARGVPSEDIFMDHAGFSTYESMYRARDVFAVESMIIVSQNYHLYRSLYDAHALGLDAHAVACYGGTWRSEPREILARCKDWLWCIFKPEPTFLGEVIPISGSGDLTNDENTEVSAAPSAEMA